MSTTSPKHWNNIGSISRPRDIRQSNDISLRTALMTDIFEGKSAQQKSTSLDFHSCRILSLFDNEIM